MPTTCTGPRSSLQPVARSRPKALLSVLILGVSCLAALPAMAQTPAVGAMAPDFTLSSPTGQALTLSSGFSKGTTVLVILRGFPGYQCPYCVKQVHDYVEHAQQFAAKKAEVIFVYPGPPADLDQHAREALAKQADLPANLHMVTDPDYKVTNRYGLRWDAPHETAYPSTFILDRTGKIVFEKVSHAHGDRTSASEIIDKL